MKFYILCLILFVWQALTFPAALARAGHSVLSAVLLPVRAFITIGLLGLLVATPQGEMAFGFSPFFSLGGRPHYWADEAKKRGCILDEDELMMVCEPAAAVPAKSKRISK